MDRRVVRRVILWLIAGVVVLGCGTPVFVASPSSVADPGSVGTTIARTAGAAQTQTMISLPSSQTPTSTLSPEKTATLSSTPTATVLFVTDTSLPEGFLVDNDSDTDGDSGSSDSDIDGGDPTETPTPTETRKPREWNCRVLSKSPTKNAVLKEKSSFTTTWTVENIGTKTWPKKGVDIIYQSGAHLHSGKPYYDLPKSIGPGGTVTIKITMTAPKYPKTVSTRWALKVGDREFCSVKFVIEVKK